MTARNGLFVRYCAKDFLDGTQTLDVWEEVAYRRLCDLIVATGGALADDARRLRWMTKTGHRWPRVREALISAGLIEVERGLLTCRQAQEMLASGRHQYLDKRPPCRWTADTREAVLAKTGGRCTYCGCALVLDRPSDRQAFTIDHVEPLVSGGSNRLDNLVPACRVCNSKKGARQA